MARVMELFVIVNALAGIATFLGVRFVWRRSKDATKRGIDVIKMDKEEEEWPPPEIEKTTHSSSAVSEPTPGTSSSALPR